MKGNLQGVLQVVVVDAAVETGHPEPQLPQYPMMWLPLVSVAVLHQGSEKPPAVVQLVYVTPKIMYFS